MTMNEEKLVIGAKWVNRTDGSDAVISALSESAVFYEKRARDGAAVEQSLHRADFVVMYEPAPGLSQASTDPAPATVAVEQTPVLGSAARMGKAIGHAVAALTTIEGRSMDLSQCQNIVAGALTSIIEVLPEVKDIVEAYRESFRAIAGHDAEEAKALRRAFEK